MSIEQMIAALSTDGVPRHWTIALTKDEATAIAGKLKAAEELVKVCDHVNVCPGVENLGAKLAEDLYEATTNYRKAGEDKWVPEYMRNTEGKESI